jgi:hypothetical protein
MFSKYFSLKYFAQRYFNKGNNAPIYTNSGDIKTSLTKPYSAGYDVETIVGIEYIKKYDVSSLILMRKPHVNVIFEYDIQTTLE